MNVKNHKHLEEKFKKLINHYNANNFVYVIKECINLLKKSPNNVFLANLLGSSFQNIGDLEKAKKIFIHLINKDANNITALNNLGNTYRGLKDYKKAKEIYKKILKVNPKYINGLLNFANLSFELNQYETAIVNYNKALVLDKNNILLLYNLGLSHQSLGNFDKAEFYFKELLLINPKMTTADKLMSRLKKYNTKNDHLVSMEEKLINSSLNEIEKTNLFFALGKAYEDLKDYKKSFAYLKKGNDNKKKITMYNPDSDDHLFNEITKFFDSYNFEKNNKLNLSDKNIIFILGLPRSGTSLVEQIISSHSQVYGCGELPFLQDLISKHFYKNKTFNSKILKEEGFSSLLQEVANKYHEQVEAFNPNEKLITDKAPLNFRLIGFIKLLFPNAKIIHCNRNAKDNCLSLYKNIFDESLNWTYTQTDLFKFYKNYLDIMKFWEKKLPGFIYNINYENLISNSNNEIKSLIKFCDLNWEESCLNFHDNKKSIKTVSSVQARQKIYTSSISSSNNYDIYLSDLFSNLEKLH